MDAEKTDSANKHVDDVKRINIKEFVEEGFLQEANRQFFHPLGLALEVIVEDDPSKEWRLGGVWDYRDDTEGILYGVGDLAERERKAVNVVKARREKLSRRAALDCCDLEGVQYPNKVR